MGLLLTNIECGEKTQYVGGVLVMALSSQIITQN